jgi:ATP-dependent RNA helicase HelY
MQCERGDVVSFVEDSGERALAALGDMRDFAQQLREGDVLCLSSEDETRAVVLARGWGANPRMILLEADGNQRRVSGADLDRTVTIIGRMVLPEPVRTRDGGYRSSVARRLRDWERDPSFHPIGHESETAGGVAGCPDLAQHLSAFRRWRRAEKEVRRLRRRMKRSDEGLVQAFRSIVALLGEWGYVEDWSLTEKGRRLRFVYNELDLLLAESVHRGAFDALNGPQLAALASLFTFEARRQDGVAAEPPDSIADRVDLIARLAVDLAKAEQEAGLPETRPPEAGFAAIAYAWAAGHDLEDLFDDDFAAGDFVRNCRQLIDVMRQLRDEFPDLRRAAAEGIAQLDRGVVAAGGRA